jgi:hypothetical protein
MERIKGDRAVFLGRTAHQSGFSSQSKKQKEPPDRFFSAESMFRP